MRCSSLRRSFHATTALCQSEADVQRLMEMEKTANEEVQGAMEAIE